MDETQVEVQKLGQYIIDKELGRGGVGKVYKALDTSLDRIVAIKTLIISNEGNVKRFLHEAKATAKLEHPNIVPIYTIEKIDNKHCLVMKFIEGTSLENLLRSQKTPINYLCQIMIKVLKAMQYAHDKGFIHRDIKPANILVDREGEPYITDFGLVKFADESSTQLTKTGAIMGTPCYMSPEQAKGTKTDYRCDIYSLGTLFYEMLVKQRAFEGESVMAILYKVVNEPPEIPRNIKVPPALLNVSLKAMEKDPKNRFQSCKEMIIAIQHAIKNPNQNIKQGQKNKQKQNPMVIILSIVCILMFIALLLQSRKNSNNQEENGTTEVVKNETTVNQNDETDSTSTNENKVANEQDENTNTTNENTTITDAQNKNVENENVTVIDEQKIESSETKNTQNDSTNNKLDNEKENNEQIIDQENQKEDDALDQDHEQIIDHESQKEDDINNNDEKMEEVKKSYFALLEHMKSQNINGIKNSLSSGFYPQIFPDVDNLLWEGIIKISGFVMYQHLINLDPVFTWEDKGNNLAKVTVGPRISDYVYFIFENGAWKCAGDKITMLIEDKNKRETNIYSHNDVKFFFQKIIEKDRRNKFSTHDNDLFHSDVAPEKYQEHLDSMGYFSLTSIRKNIERKIQKKYYINEDNDTFIIYYNFVHARGLFVRKDFGKETDGRKHIYLVLKKQDGDWKLYGIRRVF